jgi:glycosyltransferase involved in cell wall biosynthesis
MAIKYKPLVLYVCNAIDGGLKLDRSILTDSPAATGKVLAISRAIQNAGGRVVVLSLGRGKQNGKGTYFKSTTSVFEGVTFSYAAFFNFSVLTHLVTMFSLMSQFIKLCVEYKPIKPSIIFYNRSYHYVLAAFVAKLYGVSCFIDLEDGFNNSESSRTRRIYNFFTKNLFNAICSAGAVVASSHLVSQLKHKKVLICYGVAESIDSRSINWHAEQMRVIFSGTLLEEVGSQLLIDAINILKTDYYRELEKLFFVVTGKGPFAQDFSNFSIKNPRHVFFGESLPFDVYTKLLRECHVGISLRLSSYEMAKTTFPSKVIEYANNGLVVLTTKSPDIPKIFGNSAIYLEEETPVALAKLIASLPNRVAELAEKSLHGMQFVRDCCGSDRVGKNMVNFFSNASDR